MQNTMARLTPAMVFYFTGNCVSVKQKRLYVPPNARCACSAMDESKTVAALRRSRFLEAVFRENIRFGAYKSLCETAFGPLLL